MAVRTAVLGRALSSGAGNLVVGTVPAGEVWIVKEVLAINLSGVNRTYQPGAEDATNAFVLAWEAQQTLANGAVDYQKNLFTVLAAGDKLQCTIGGAGVYVWASGSRLVLNPP